MFTTAKERNAVRRLLLADTENKTFKKEELCNIVSKLIKNIDNSNTTEVVEFIAQYLYVNDDKVYYFNTKKKRKKFSNNIKLLTPKKTVEDNLSDSIDSEEMRRVEEEFFNKTKKKTKKLKSSKNIFSNEKLPRVVKRTDVDNGPYGTQWVHDIQFDDPLDDLLEERAVKYDKLRAVVLPEQRSKEWFEMRYGKITASDGGCVIGVNKHEPAYKFIIKKVTSPPFPPNRFCYHGKKLEEPATMAYEYRMNVTVEEFGLMGHEKHKFLGASPDGIVCRYKLDGKHTTKYVGRMLEIKCPVSRKINKTGKIKGEQCPIYYWVQVQLQLECCDLEECDFWQCSLSEYDTREDFVNDTDKDEPFRSEETGYEKGCLIQLIPKSQVLNVMNGDYEKVIWDHAIFMYPEEIEMTPEDCDTWVNEKLKELNDEKYKDYVFDRVIYWKITDTHNVTIDRDRKWFAEYLPVYEQTWKYVEFFRANEDKMNMLLEYIEKQSIKKNDKIMAVVEKLYNTSNPNYDQCISDLKEEISNTVKKVRAKRSYPNFSTSSAKGVDDDCMFVD